jgi:diacylglycerol kinase (ATP)
VRNSLLVYNPAAGQWWRRPPPERLRDALARHGYRAELLVTRGQDHATELVREHLRPETEVVWVCGGDGTLGQAATPLVDSEVPLGILPSGTVNVIARECGIPADPEKAVEVLVRTPARRALRTWRMDGRAVLLGIGVGFDARAMGRVSRRWKDLLGLLAIGARGLVEWARYEFPALQVTGEDGEGHPFSLASTQVLVSNTRRFAGHHAVLPAADPEDGCLDVLLFQGRSHPRLAAFWVGVELPGTLHLRVPGVRTLRVRRLRVSAEGGRPVEAHVDGDVVSTTPVEVEPWGSVQLLVPHLHQPY